MTEKEIRRLGKTELLSIIRDQEAELEQMRTQLAQLQEQSKNRTIELEKCGSIAEASIQVNQVFQAAQAAADQYIASVRAKEANAEKATAQLEAQAREMANARLRATEESCRQMETESRNRAEAFWTTLQVQLEQFYKDHAGLKEILLTAGINVQIPKPENLK